ncbi:MAG: hypothetical protein H0U77_10695 [Nocardioidaceae bacterium]|nr:hypothetical protein [Nocardioidaceae bacterium]
MTDQRVADPFDLPDWIGAHDTTWTALGAVGERQVHGLLSADSIDGADPLHDAVSLSVLSADVAYPEPVLSESLRRSAHQSWVHGEVLLVCHNGRFVLTVPGTGLGADLLCETIRRFARSVGAPTERLTVALRL